MAKTSWILPGYKSVESIQLKNMHHNFSVYTQEKILLYNLSSLLAEERENFKIYINITRQGHRKTWNFRS